jgi:hypothetical protein
MRIAGLPSTLPPPARVGTKPRRSASCLYLSMSTRIRPPLTASISNGRVRRGASRVVAVAIMGIGFRLPDKVHGPRLAA